MGFQYLTNAPLEDAVRDYVEKLRERGFGPGTETVSIWEAAGRVTARAVYAHICAPHYHACAMDGIAVNAESTFTASTRRPLRLTIGTDAFWINTGHPLPAGTNAVVMVENVNTEPDGQHVVIEKAAFPWQHVRKLGEDMVASEIILPPGVCIGPYELGALAAGGEEVVELTENGTSATVRGIKGGQTVLSVSAGGYTAVTCKLTVTAAVKNEFTLSSSSLSVEAGKTGTFTVTIADGSAVTAADLEVMSEDDTVATAAIDGTTVTVTGLKKGTVNIFVTAEGSLSASVSVTVTEPQKDPGTATDPGDNGTASDPGDNGTDDGKEGGCGSFAGAGSLLGGGAVLALGALLMKKKK